MNPLERFSELVGNDTSPMLSSELESLFKQISEEDRRKIIDPYRKQAELPFEEYFKSRPDESMADVYKTRRGGHGRGAPSIGDPDVGVKYADHLKPDRVNEILNRGKRSLDTSETAIFKQMVAGRNTETADISVVSGYDSVFEERQRVLNELDTRMGGASNDKPTAKEKTSHEKPPINKTKVNDTTEEYRSSTEQKAETPKKKKSQRPIPGSHQDYNPDLNYNTNLNPSYNTNLNPVGKPAYDMKKASNFLKVNRGKLALGSLGLGLAKSLVDDEEDDLGSTVGKTLKVGVLGVGATYGAEKLFKTETIQDMVRGEVADVSKSIRDKSKSASRLMKAGSSLPGALKIGAAVVAGATILDIGGSLSDKAEDKRMKKESEQKIKDRESRQQEKNKKFSYSSINDGEILFDLFNQRTGHHKMGNSRFQ